MKKILNTFLFCILIVILIGLFNVYKKINFNEFSKSEYIQYNSEFLRDSEIKYSNMDSYKIVSNNYNDAMFYKKIDVTPNTVYRVTAMVKTENIKTEKGKTEAGANICISDTTEKSISLIGTNDWTKLEFMFNSKNRTSVNLGFRLGSYDDNCTGTAWFSDFKIEQGNANTSNYWKYVCFVIENVDLYTEVNGKKTHIVTQMSEADKNTIVQNMERFKTSINSLSRKQY